MPVQLPIHIPIRLRRAHDRHPVIIKIHRLPIPKRILQRSRNLRRLKRILGITSQRRPIQHRRRKLRKVVQKRLLIKHKRIRSRGRAHTMRVPDLHSVARRVAVDEGVGLGAAHAGGALEAVLEGAADVRGEYFAVGEFDDAPAVVAVLVVGELVVDCVLPEGVHAVDLSFWVGEARLDVEVESADVDL